MKFQLRDSGRPVPLYYFDHSSAHFEQILDLYRHGKLHLGGGGDNDACAMAAADELDYWGIETANLQPCCALK